MTQWIVDEYIASLKEEEDYSLNTLQTSNNLSLVDKKFQVVKDSDWDSGFSDG